MPWAWASRFSRARGPKFERVVRDEAAVAQLAVPDMDKLRFVFDAVTSIRKALNGRVPLIGFSGSPGLWPATWSRAVARRLPPRQEPDVLEADLMHRILDTNARAVAAYLNAQIEAGAQAVMVFDSWGGVLADGPSRPSASLTRARCWRRSRPSTRACASRASSSPGRWPVAGRVGRHRGRRDRPRLDHEPRQSPRPRGPQGRAASNLDPNVLFAPPDAVRAQARAVLDSFGPPQRADGGWDGHIFNLRHGIAQPRRRPSMWSIWWTRFMPIPGSSVKA